MSMASSGSVAYATAWRARMSFERRPADGEFPEHVLAGTAGYYNFQIALFPYGGYVVERRLGDVHFAGSHRREARLRLRHGLDYEPIEMWRAHVLNGSAEIPVVGILLHLDNVALDPLHKLEWACTDGGT